MKMIRGLSNINAKGFPNNKGVHAVPINETPDIATIGKAVRSILLISVSQSQLSGEQSSTL
jgi:hypothetical protein